MRLRTARAGPLRSALRLLAASRLSRAIRVRRHALTGGIRRIYNTPCTFSWDEEKRQANLKDHGLDFVDAEKVFEGPTFTYEDDRFDYGEQRFMTLGFLGGIAVSIVHTETEDEIRVISFRKATANEEAILFNSLED